MSSRTQQVYWYAFPSDLVASGKVKVQAVSGPDLVVSLPSVHRQDQEIIVSGTVSRSADSNTAIPGFLEVQILGPTGGVADKATVHWNPPNLPSAGKGGGRYEVRLVGVPEEGSTVRVAYTLSPKDIAKKQATAPSRTPSSAATGANHDAPPAAQRWAPPYEVQRLGDAQVRILSAEVRAPDSPATGDGTSDSRPAGAPANTSRKLLVTVEIRNTADSGGLLYTTWSRPNTAYLSETGATAVFVHNLAGATPEAKIPPGRAITDVIAFDPPDAKVKSVQLELLGPALRASGEARFEVPIPYPPLPSSH